MAKWLHRWRIRRKQHLIRSSRGIGMKKDKWNGLLELLCLNRMENSLTFPLYWSIRCWTSQIIRFGIYRPRIFYFVGCIGVIDKDMIIDDIGVSWRRPVPWRGWSFESSLTPSWLGVHWRSHPWRGVHWRPHPWRGVPWRLSSLAWRILKNRPIGVAVFGDGPLYRFLTAALFAAKRFSKVKISDLINECPAFNRFCACADFPSSWHWSCD